MWRSWFKRKENLIAVGLALLVLGLHFIVINNPHKGRPLDREGKVVENVTGFSPDIHYEGQILDEQHYVVEANSIIHDQKLLHPEHPSLGKLIISAGIRIFGNNAFGWRFFSVIFGTISIILFYLICQKLTSRRYVPLLATFLFAFENSAFVQASVGMLDVFLVTFMLAAFLLYLHGRYYTSGIALALSSVVKFSAASAGIAIALHWLLTRRKPKRDALKFMITAPLAFMVLMPLVDWLATGDFLNPVERVRYMIETHSTLTFGNITAGNASRPWEWVLSPVAMAFWFSPSYYSGVNWTMWALILPSMAYSIWGTIKRNDLLAFAIFWFAATYLVWIPVELITDRLMFRFYFYPTVGAICLALGFAIAEIMTFSSRLRYVRIRWTIRGLVGAWMVANLVVFLGMSPLL